MGPFFCLKVCYLLAMSSKKRRDIPDYQLPIIETHFHLDMLKAFSADEIIEKCRTHNIEKMITISTSEENFDTVIELSHRYPELYCTQGIHPHDGSEWNQEAREHIKRNLDNKNNTKIIAIGEIGLDYYYTKSPREDQIKSFEEQLQLACDYNLPVVIHTRDADEDTISVLKNFSTKLSKKGVIHSFTSGLDLCDFCLKEGFSIGFNGIITFKSAQNVRDALNIVPPERILLETDSPFLTPEPYRGVENAPYYLPFVAEKIAEVKGLSVEKILDITYQNAKNLFHL